MAKLTITQTKLNVERELARQETVRNKLENQKKKEIVGEHWKDIEREQMRKELEDEIGDTRLPKITDTVDTYSFFSPLKFYKDNSGDVLKMDYKNFQESEAKFNKILKNEAVELLELQNNSEEESGALLKDGIEEDYPDYFDNEEKNPIVIAKEKINEIIGRYFNRFVPLYNKHICTCCGIPKTINNYYIVYNLTCSSRIDLKGNYHAWICKDCCQRLLMYYYSVITQKNLELAMQYLCANLNWYWDMDLFQISRRKFEDSDRTGTLIGWYIKEINRSAVGMSFMDSPFLQDKYEADYSTKVEKSDSDAPFEWTKEEAKNKKTVIRMVGYDPFEYESDNDKRILYKDLLNILDEGMENDFVKFQAGIQIVQSFYKIRKMNERLLRMEREDAPLRDQKDVAELKAKELRSITDFSRDNGFAERYSTAKAKGENTLTGIMNKMNEQKYEKAILNRYDIETSETIQQAADASFKAIFNQLGMGESEVWKITQDQFAELSKLRKENAKLQEDLRKAKYVIAESNLRERAKSQNSLDEDEE